MARASKSFVSIEEFLNHFGGAFTPVYDETIHRFKPDGGRSKSGWYVARQSGSISMIIAGDFRDGNEWHLWCSKSRKNKQEREQLAAFQKEAITKYKEIEEEVQSSLKVENWELLQADITDKCPWHEYPYFKEKKIDQLYCARFINLDGKPICVIPMMDTSGEVWNFQKIHPDGKKLFNKGRAKGLFATINGDKHTVYVCEGFATAVSIHKATGSQVFITFSAGNMMTACRNLQKLNPGQRIIVCADNDHTKNTNTGLKEAIKIEEKLKIPYLLPIFAQNSTGTDFNDMEIETGLDSVKQVLGQTVGLSKNEGEGHEEYEKYINFFEELMPTARRCPLNGKIYIKKFNGWQEVINDLKILRADARIAGISHRNVEDYLSKWEDVKEKKWLCEFEQWDGKDHIGIALCSLLPSNIKIDYFHELMKEWFATIFKRAEDNTIQNKMVILHGAQGAGKDHWISTMFKSLQPYFSNIMLMKNKEADLYMSMARKLVLNISEFEQSSKLELATIKNMITIQNSELRTPYARGPANATFRTSFISTCNYQDIFRDESGNRRFLYFELAKITWDYPMNSSAQIIAQARHLASVDYQASNEAKEAMRLILESNTPDSIHDMIKESWVAEMTAISKSRSMIRWRYTDVKHVVSDIAKDLGVKPKFVLQSIKLAGFTHHDMKGRYYTFNHEKVYADGQNISNDENMERVAHKLTNYAPL